MASTEAERGSGSSSASSPTILPGVEDHERAALAVGAQFALDDDVETIARFALTDQAFARRHFDLFDDAGDGGQDMVRRPGKDIDGFHDGDALDGQQHRTGFPRV